MWFLERVSRSVENLTMPADGPRPPPARRQPPRAHFNVLTPDRIPEFFIPPRLPAGPEHPAGREGVCRDLLKVASLHVIQIENVDQDWGAASEEEEEEERWRGSEGGPERASRVPLRANPAEIIYLPESPHTRRKESLFHVRGPRWRDPAGDDPLRLSSSSLDGQHPPSRSTPADPRASGAPDSDTASSAESSPFSSPLLSRCLVRRAVKQQALIARRSRFKGSAARASSLSTDDCSSADNSPGALRRPERCSLAPPPAPLYPPDFVRCPQRLTKESAVALDTGGTVRLSAEYVAEGRRLRLRLVNGEGLYPPSFAPRAVSCCVVLSLLPGKGQKQRSTIIKKSRNPIFNEDFFFEGVTQEHLERKTVKVKVLNKGSGMKRDCIMGESQVDLASILPNIHTLNKG